MDEMIKNRLRKLRELALRGVGGERENAEQLLDQLIKKYGVSLADLDESNVKRFELEYHGDEDEKLLLQIIYMVLNDVDCVYGMIYEGSGRKCRTRKSVHCTEAQKLEIEFLHEFYQRLWAKEKAYFLEAFIQKHSLFGTKYAKSSKINRLTAEELAKIGMMQRGISDATPRKLLEE